MRPLFLLLDLLFPLFPGIYFQANKKFPPTTKEPMIISLSLGKV